MQVAPSLPNKTAEVPSLCIVIFRSPTQSIVIYTLSSTFLMIADRPEQSVFGITKETLTEPGSGTRSAPAQAPEDT